MIIVSGPERKIESWQGKYGLERRLKSNCEKPANPGAFIANRGILRGKKYAQGKDRDFKALRDTGLAFGPGPLGLPGPNCWWGIPRKKNSQGNPGTFGKGFPRELEFRA